MSYIIDSRRSIEEFDKQWPLIREYFYPDSELIVDIEKLAIERHEILAKIYDQTIGSDKLLQESKYLFTLGTRFQWTPKPKQNEDNSYFWIGFNKDIFNPTCCSVTIGAGRERSGYLPEYTEYEKKLDAVLHGGQYPRDTLQCYINGYQGELIYGILVDTKNMYGFLHYQAGEGSRREVEEQRADYFVTQRRKDDELNKFMVILNRIAKREGFLLNEFKNIKYFNFNARRSHA